MFRISFFPLLLPNLHRRAAQKVHDFESIFHVFLYKLLI